MQTVAHYNTNLNKPGVILVAFRITEQPPAFEPTKNTFYSPAIVYDASVVFLFGSDCSLAVLV